jgi:hypothetical protein
MGMAVSDKKQSVAEMASQLRANGFEPVPIERDSKRPTIAKWQRGGIQDAAWGPEDGIGVLCGHGDLVAVDVDTDDPKVLEKIAALLPPGCPRKRGAKGLTFFVRAKVDKKCSLPVGLKFDGDKCVVQHVEVLTHGQYTVLPPSIHPETKKPYEWIAGAGGPTQSLYDLHLEDIPVFEGDLQGSLRRVLDQEIVHPDLVAACRTIASSSEGARNTIFNKEVFALAIGRVDLHENTVKKWVTEAARHAGLTDSEIAATFKSAAKGAERKSRATTAKPALSLTLYRDIDPQPRKDWLVHDFLGAGEVSCWFGQPGAGKSTIAIDLACHVASDKLWMGRRVLHIGVLYVAAERVAVVHRRLAAFRKHHDEVDIPLAVVGGPADLRSSPDHANLVIEYAGKLTAEFGHPVRLIIIETINRVLAGGNENDSADMGGLLNTFAFIQEATGAHILTVHHTPIKEKRLRGHSSLLGMCDTTVLVEKSGSGYTAKIEKSNDGPSGEPVGWTVESIELYRDPETEETTCAPVVVPDCCSASPGKSDVTQAEITMLQILLEAEARGLATGAWYAAARARGIGIGRTATLTELKTKLEDRGLIVEQDGIWRANLNENRRLELFGPNNENVKGVGPVNGRTVRTST